jgi:hypothetical protein
MWRYKYSSITEFFSDYNNWSETGIWTEYGRIDSIQNTPYNNTATDGSIILYILQPGSKIKNLNRYTFSTESFLNLYFSKEIPGINLYTSEDPLNRNTITWDALLDEQKKYYIDAANRLIKGNYMRVYWPIDPFRNQAPTIQIKINNTLISNGSTYVLPRSPLASGQIVDFFIEVTNIGISPLNIQLPASLDTIENFNFTSNFTKKYFGKDERENLNLKFVSYSVGTKEAYLTIESNDPTAPKFIVKLLTQVVSSTGEIAPLIDVAPINGITVFQLGTELQSVDVAVSATRTFQDIFFVSLAEESGIEFVRWGESTVITGGVFDYTWIPSQAPIVNSTFIKAIASDGLNSSHKVLEFKFQNKVYWGYSPSGSLQNEEILFLNQSRLTENLSGVYDFGNNPGTSSGESQYLYFYFPKRLGQIDYIEDLINGFTYIPSAHFVSFDFNLSNELNFIEQYQGYRTNNKTLSSALSWRVVVK